MSFGLSIFNRTVYRITEWSGLAGTSVGHLVQPPCRSRVSYSRLHRIPSRQVLGLHLTIFFIFLNWVLPEKSDCGRDLLSCIGYVSMICEAKNSTSFRLQPPNCPARPNSARLCRTRPPPHPGSLEKCLSEKRQFVQTVLMAWLKLSGGCFWFLMIMTS